MRHSYTISLNFAASTQSVLITAQNSSFMLASIAMRGYLLWFINLFLAVYLFTQTFRVSDYNRTRNNQRNAVDKGHVNETFNNSEFQGHSVFKNQPIQAYEMQ